MINKIYLDANILIAHQVKNHQHHEKAVKIIDDLWQKKYVFVISSLTWDEFFYGLTFIFRSLHKNKKHTPFKEYALTIAKASEVILSWEKIECTEFKHNPYEVKAVIRLMADYNLRPRDAFHLRIMQQQEVKNIATFDRDFNQLSKKEEITIFS